FSAVWVAVAFTIAKTAPTLASIMLVGYPLWDAAANFVDAQRNGGLRSNKAQALNVLASAIATIAVVVALGRGMGSVLVVFGIWASFSGIFQLATAVSPLEDLWRAMGDDPERCPVRAGWIFLCKDGGRS